MDWDKVEAFLGSENPIVKELATQLNDLKIKYEAGSLSADEFKDLSGDILHLQTIDVAASELDGQTEIGQAIQLMTSVVEAFLP